MNKILKHHQNLLTNPVGSDFSNGWRYPLIEQVRPDVSTERKMCNLHIVEIGFGMNQSGKRAEKELYYKQINLVSVWKYIWKKVSMSVKHFILPRVFYSLKHRTVLSYVSHLELFIFQS